MKSLIFDLAGLLALLLAVVLSSCRKENTCVSACIEFCVSGTKALVPDERKISDINLYVTGEGGIEEFHTFFKAGEGSRLPLKLLGGRNYSFYAYANAGYDCGHLDGRPIESLAHFLSYPDSYEHGMPMCALIKDRYVQQDDNIRMSFVQMMSKISISIDRSALDKDVSFMVTSIRIGNCPKSASVWAESAAKSKDDFFSGGFVKSGGEVSGLNYEGTDGRSDEVSVFMLENCHGAMGSATLNTDLCSYIEMEVDYDSLDKYSTGRGLIYRFYIKEHDAYRVERGCHYHVTVKPRGRGTLCEDDWRLDKSNLRDYGNNAYLKFTPGGSTVGGVWYPNYYNLKRGSSLHLDIEREPARMDIWLDRETMDDDLADGRISWELDEDGSGLWIRSLGTPCSAPMEIFAGPPLDDSEIIYVNVY